MAHVSPVLPCVLKGSSLGVGYYFFFHFFIHNYWFNIIIFQILFLRVIIFSIINTFTGNIMTKLFLLYKFFLFAIHYFFPINTTTTHYPPTNNSTAKVESFSNFQNKGKQDKKRNAGGFYAVDSSGKIIAEEYYKVGNEG